MSLKFTLVGNPNSGKTTLFNGLTGSNQYVGNWPGVTVEKKTGKIKGHQDIDLMDLPGIYSLSPYSPEEVIARNYLLSERPDCIINIVDGSNIERNLYLTTQLLELNIPVVVAINMMDVVNKNGDALNADRLGELLSCPCVPISALKGSGLDVLVETARKTVNMSNMDDRFIRFDQITEKALTSIETQLRNSGETKDLRYLSIKLFERDIELGQRYRELLDYESIISEVESSLNDDSDSIITNERYDFVIDTLGKSFKKANDSIHTLSDKIDKIVTNRILALPIFAAVMFLVYFISISTIGTWVTDWANDGVFGEGWHLFGIKSIFVPSVPDLVAALLERIATADWLNSLILDGIIAGVGAVLGFLPQIAVLFFLLSILEDCGYMSRIAFILDNIFRRFGLSGKSFIPMLVSTGCAVPGVMSTRTIENENDRRMTIMTTTFMPCGAKLPVIALIAGALFGGAWWVAPLSYFAGIAAVIVSGIILKKTRLFAGDPAPFVMELPAYHMPQGSNVIRRVGERSWDYAKRAASIIMLSSIIIWFLSNFGFVNGRPARVEDINTGFLANIGNTFAGLFAPLGFGHWQAAVASITGLIAKENIVGTLGVLYGYGEVSEAGNEIWQTLALSFGTIGGFSFLLFNLLCAPCFAAIAAIRKEMADRRWTVFAIVYQCGLAYTVSLIYYQLASWFNGSPFTFTTAAGIILLIVMIYLLVRPKPALSLKGVPVTSGKGA